MKLTNFFPSQHALDRAKLRFGIELSDATEWFNELMKDANYVSSNGKYRLTYESSGLQIIVDIRNNAIVTVHDSLKLDFLRPSIEREMRRMKREFTKKRRQIELDQALSMQKHAELAVNKAKARNPNTRSLIEGRMDEVKTIIKGYEMRIKRMEDEFYAKCKAVELISE